MLQVSCLIQLVFLPYPSYQRLIYKYKFVVKRIIWNNLKESSCLFADWKWHDKDGVLISVFPHSTRIAY